MSLPTCPSCIYAKGICEKTGVKISYSTGCTYHKRKPITNADRIRAMSDEELAQFMKPYDSGCPRWNGKEPMPCPERTNCRDCWLDWLKATVEEG